MSNSFHHIYLLMLEIGVLKNRDITLLTKVYVIKVMDGCESWTVKKAEY